MGDCDHKIRKIRHAIVHTHLSWSRKQFCRSLEIAKALKKNFLDDLSNSGRPFDYIVKAGQPARPKT
jgi:hypothetical protein